jgi:hypothetical protein
MRNQNYGYRISIKSLHERTHIGIGLSITEEPSQTTERTDRVSGDSADQAD